MHLCLDIDDTITYTPDFFVNLIETMKPKEVSIVSFRTERTSTVEYLESIGLKYDRLILSSDPEQGRKEDEMFHHWKANLVNELKPDLFFEDMPEVVGLIDDSIKVFMPCDKIIREWIREKVSFA